MTTPVSGDRVALTMRGAVAYVEIRRSSAHNALDIETASALLERCRQLNDGHEAVSLLTTIDAPVIAKLRGHVAGGSMSLSLACDVVPSAPAAWASSIESSPRLSSTRSSTRLPAAWRKGRPGRSGA